jgi:quercetin dioxygenase-like cupin family protein
MRSKKCVLTAGACVTFVLAGAIAYSATSNFFVSNAVVAHSDFFDGPATMSVREFTIAPGEVLPWHYHPGVVMVAVKSGTLTHEEGCGRVDTYTGGQAFEKFHMDVHRAKNLGTVPVVLYDTFIIPSGQPTTISIPNNEQLCGPPTNVASCRQGGWSNFSFPRVFDNQGDCEQWVITGK